MVTTSEKAQTEDIIVTKAGAPPNKSKSYTWEEVAAA